MKGGRGGGGCGWERGDWGGNVLRRGQHDGAG